MDTEMVLRGLPSVEKLASLDLLGEWRARFSHAVRVKVSRAVVESARRQMRTGQGLPTLEGIAEKVVHELERLHSGKMRKVLNATGVILHTNLGRAPLGKKLLEEMANELDGYTNLEFDLETGGRGRRGRHVEEVLALLTGAPAVIVVNNNAAAMFLVLHTLAGQKAAVLSRGELVQIGGGFRVPEILEAAGTRLIEVGTTNMTSAKDFERAVERHRGEVALLLKIHQSNFAQVGHVENVGVTALAQVARTDGLTLAVDLGSGALVPGLSDEPTVMQVLSQGADIVTFSGDKCLGGPQAGIIVGKKSLIEKLRSSPIYRALRLGKLDLFALERVLWSYVANERNPTLEAALATEESLQDRALSFLEAIKDLYPGARIETGSAVLGGGSGAGKSIPTRLIDLGVENAEARARRLLQGENPLVCRRENGRLLIDLRTLSAEDEKLAIGKLRSLEASCTS